VLGEILDVRLGFTADTHFVVGLSGGGDSVALLHALAATSRRTRAVHIDHGLQAASRQWAEACRGLCAKIGIPCRVERVLVSAIGERGYEAAAREARYARLRDVLEPGEVLLTAHHQDDQAETVLLQMLRGAGVPGMAAMPEVTPFGVGLHVRPLLAFRRAALRDYLAAEGLAWVEDESNEDPSRSRSIVRQRVLPLLTEHWPGAVATLARSARNAAQAQSLLDELAIQDVAANADGNGRLVASKLPGLSVARQTNLIRFWLRSHDLPVPSASQCDEILRMVAQRPRSGTAVVRWTGAMVRLHRDSLTVAKTEPMPGSWTPQVWDLEAPLEIVAAGVRLRSERTTGSGLSLARIAGRPVSVRPRIGGEICRPAGSRHRRSLKKLFQENAVPPWQRARVPLVYVGEDLAAVGDRWVCEPYAAAAAEPGVRLVVEDIFRDAPARER